MLNKNIISQDYNIASNLKANITKGLIVQAVYDGEIWASRGYSIYKSSNDGISFHKQFNASSTFTAINIISKRKTARRVAGKPEVVEFVMKPCGTYIIFPGGAVYISDDKGKTFKQVNTLKKYGYKVGRGVMTQGITIDKRGYIYYGEYCNNPKRDAVSIYYSPDD